MFCFIFFFHKEAAGLGPKVGADDPFVVKHVKRAVDRDADFGEVREDVFFRIPCVRQIRLYKQKDGFQQPPLGVHFDIQPRVRASLEGEHFKVHLVIRKLFGGGVHGASIVSQHLAADHLVFELDVGQLVFQLCLIRAFDHLRSLCQRQFKREVIVQRRRVENAVVSQDLMVQPDSVLGPVYGFQFIFSFDSRGFLVPRA